jgi:uncharacterized membrane protein YfcA
VEFAKHFKFIGWLAIAALIVMGATFATSSTVLAQDAKIAADSAPAKIQAAIAKSLKDPKTAEATKKASAAGIKERGDSPGYMGLLGAPSPSWWVGLLWAIWVGWVFSTVGAFGGIMAGVGHITVFGLADYAKTYGKGNPVNKLLTDSIRVSNQWLVGLSGLVSSFNYYKMGRLVAPLGAALAVGGMAGSWMIPDLTAGQISLKAYLGYFGIIVLVLGCFLIYQMSPKGQAGKKAAKEAAAAFEKAKGEGGSGEQGVKIVGGNMTMIWIALALVFLSALCFNFWGKAGGTMLAVSYILAIAGWIVAFMAGTIKFTFYGVEFEFKAVIPVVGGIFIAAIASFLGIGGGFLFVPFLTSVAGLPMFLVAGTSALCVLIGMIVSVFSYMVGKGVIIEWGLVMAELVGIFIGSMIGPRTSKFIPDKGLKIIFIVLAFYVGIRYMSKGFFGTSWVPPF